MIWIFTFLGFFGRLLFSHGLLNRYWAHRHIWYLKLNPAFISRWPRLHASSQSCGLHLQPLSGTDGTWWDEALPSDDLQQIPYEAHTHFNTSPLFYMSFLSHHLFIDHKQSKKSTDMQRENDKNSQGWLEEKKIKHGVRWILRNL